MFLWMKISKQNKDKKEILIKIQILSLKRLSKIINNHLNHKLKILVKKLNNNKYKLNYTN